MLYMLDTDICSYIIRQDSKVIRNLKNHSRDTTAISVITRMELLFGSQIRQSASLSALVHDFISLMKIIDFDSNAADECARIRAVLQKNGKSIGAMDAMIASSAIAAGAILVTNNIKHFSRIPKLKVENWR